MLEDNDTRAGRPVTLELEGQLERVTYRNEENHFTIARLKVKGRSDLVTVVGNLIATSPGEILRLKGTWDVHPKYGEQFRFSSYESVIPATAKGIERYLGSGLIKGIGPVMAKRLVDKFGTETLEIIETDIGRLSGVEGIGAKRIDMIGAAWAEQKEIREVMLFLQSHEVSSSYAARIFRHYGKDSIKVVRENPYRLADDIFGIGFLTADRISEKLGIPRESHMRAEAGIMHVLLRLSDEGHVYYPYGALVEECEKILGIGEFIIMRAIEQIERDKKIVLDDVPGGRAVYLAGLHASESGIADKLKRLAGVAKTSGFFDVDRALDHAQKELGVTFAGKQREAVGGALDHKVMVITGGPGTGKTTIIRAIIGIYRNLGREVLLAAPTGRAAKKMSEASGFEAKTIHRLLEFSPGQGGFKKNAEHPLRADLVIIDETSMVDTVLMHHLLKAVPDPATLILVGDVDQIPSVGAGNVLRDIIDSRCVPTVRMNEIFRQSCDSLIIVNSHRINNGEFPVLSSSKETLQDFYFIEIEEPEKAVEMIVHMCRNRIPEKFGFDPLNDIQVLTPMHRGVAGSANLNIELQKNLNPSADELVRGGKVLKTGDKVMQMRNNYDKEVYNGDIGRIVSINREYHEAGVDYDGRIVKYEFIELDEIVPAYAITVHKSQGSEYPAVIIPFLTQHYMMLQRNLLYTAITRGKKLVVVIGTKRALAIAIKNNKPQMRYTRLKERLQEALAVL